MRGGERHEPGFFCRPELATTDAAAAKTFYGDLFGWIPRETPAGPGTTDTIFTLGGRDAAALHSLAESRGERGLAAHWNTYVSVASADAAADRARSLGGTVVSEPFDVGTKGRTAVVTDPQGAAICLWEAKGLSGIGVEGEIGALCWTELATRDVAGALLFYGGLFDWTFKKSAADDDYTEIAVRGNFVGGILAFEEGSGPMPPAWNPFFRVADCDVTVARAKARRARPLAGPSDVPNFGRYAYLCDPQGAMFAAISFEAVA